MVTLISLQRHFDRILLSPQNPGDHQRSPVDGHVRFHVTSLAVCQPRQSSNSQGHRVEESLAAQLVRPMRDFRKRWSRSTASTMTAVEKALWAQPASSARQMILLLHGVDFPHRTLERTGYLRVLIRLLLTTRGAATWKSFMLAAPGPRTNGPSVRCHPFFSYA